jgi:hypothetical protein
VHYIEPFAGSLAVLLSRPSVGACETVNDADGLLANFWRAMVMAPEATADAASWPVNECDLHARHTWLLGRREDITARLMGDPSWCDPVAAGWWVWGISAWIGSGWCSGRGPWGSVDGVFGRLPDHGPGVLRKLPHIGNHGRGVHRTLPHPADLTRQRYWLGTLVERLRYVRVACGDWERVCRSTATIFPVRSGSTGVFLDPPYTVGAELYAVNEQPQARVQDWCLRHQDDAGLAVVLCGYDGEYDLPGWQVIPWEAGPSYAKAAGHPENSKRERLWLNRAAAANLEAARAAPDKGPGIQMELDRPEE